MSETELPETTSDKPVSIDAALHKRAKVYAAKFGVSIKWMVETALRQYLLKNTLFNGGGK